MGVTASLEVLHPSTQTIDDLAQAPNSPAALARATGGPPHAEAA